MGDFSLELNEDQLQIQKWVHDFAENVIRPVHAEKIIADHGCPQGQGYFGIMPAPPIGEKERREGDQPQQQQEWQNHPWIRLK